MEGIQIPQAYLVERLGFVAPMLLSMGIKPIEHLEFSLFFGIAQPLTLMFGLIVARWCPSTQQIFARHLDAKPRQPDSLKAPAPVVYRVRSPESPWLFVQWRASAISGFLAGLAIIASLSFANYRPIEFLYFQF